MKYDGTLYHNLISIVWTLVYKDFILTDGKMNPIIPKLLTTLWDYQRERPISNEEYLQLYQIAHWIDHKISEDKLPPIFKDCVPEHVRKSATEAYLDFDKPSFPS
jgi:hypothetical protein